MFAVVVDTRMIRQVSDALAWHLPCSLEREPRVPIFPCGEEPYRLRIAEKNGEQFHALAKSASVRHFGI